MDDFFRCFLFFLVTCSIVTVNGFARYSKPRVYSYNGSNDPGSPLILTPYIQSGKLDDAIKMSEVNGIGDHKSYSGHTRYFTVDKDYNSNMFFWFFPAQSGSADAPLLLWLQGGPGGSSMFGLFVENGPLMVDKNGEVHTRNITWNKDYHMLYIDNPVGTGYSFTENERGLSRDENEVADNLYSTLIQFFSVFTDYQKCDFYVTGESYAGKYIPAIGYKINQENPKAKLKINLVGFALGDALIDPVNMLGYGELLFEIGMATREEADYVNQETDRMIEYINDGKYSEAFSVFDVLLNGDLYPYPTYFYNITGTTNYFNYLLIQAPPEFDYFPKFLTSDETRKAIHVGKTNFSQGNEVEMALLEDVMASMAPNFTVLLEKYKVLLYNGQLDIIVGVPLTENFLEKLKWSGHDDFFKANKTMWMVDKALAGYIRQHDKLRQVVVLDAGHILPFDQPSRAYAMIKSFIEDF